MRTESREPAAQSRAGEKIGRGRLSRDMTTAVNGIFLICVFFRHLFQYREFPGGGWQGLRWIDAHLGQFIVVSFLFFSGYGVMESIRSRGEDYVRSMPRRRVLTTWLRFLICLIPYLAAARLLGTDCPPRQILLSALAWESAGNSNWYIFVILCLYLLTGLAWQLAGGESARMVGIHTLLVAGLAMFLSLFREEYWYNTIFTYTAGMAWSVWGEDRAPHRASLSTAAAAVIWAGLWIICLVLREWVPAYQLAAVLAGFTLAAVLAGAASAAGERRSALPEVPAGTGPVRAVGGVFRWMGRHLFGLYMMQRLPMLLLADAELGDLSYMLICLLLTLVLGWLMDVLTTRLVGALVCGGRESEKSS